MKIEVEYEASWRNSFLDRNNNEALPKNGRKYIASTDGLSKNKNYITRDISLNTVMGILNRLIGDQKKLYQTRKDEKYYFKDIEKLVTFFDDIEVTNNEIVYLRNISGNFDKKGFTGSVNTNHVLFSSSYSHDLWSILDLNLKELIDFILNMKLHEVSEKKDINPLHFEEKISFFKDIKVTKLEENDITYIDIMKVVDYFKSNTKINTNLKENFPKLRKVFSDIEYIKNEKLVVRALYCSSLYLQSIFLMEKYEIKDLYLKGFSVNGFTPKDFTSLFTAGKKLAYGNPYMAKSFIKGEGKVTSKLTKANGTLEITLDISRDKAKELKTMIENAGVSSFYLGKKGLAYVTNIDTREEK